MPIHSIAYGIALLIPLAGCSANIDAGTSPKPGATDAAPPPPSTAPFDAGSEATVDGSVQIDADNGAPSTTYPAPHPSPPLASSGGGAVLSKPKIVPVFFPNDPYVAAIQDLTSKIGTSDYWNAVVHEYGVGPATSAPPVILTETPPAQLTDADIGQWLMAKLDGTHPEFGPPDSQTIYTIYYPSTTTINMTGSPSAGGSDAGAAPDGGAPVDAGGGGLGTSCVDFGGYHMALTVRGTPMAYAVIPECPTFGGLLGVDVATGASSHEWVEAVTDPFMDGYVADDLAYADLLQGALELGDLCVVDSSPFFTPSDLGHVVQRTWSNATASAGHNPCAPSPLKSAYFNAAPAKLDDVTAQMNGFSARGRGISLKPNATNTIDIALFSDRDTGGPWTVDARELSKSSSLNLALDRTSGVNGEKLHLTVSFRVPPPSGYATFVLVSRLGNDQHVWPVIVVSP